jgi:hypothetical protein
MTSSLLLTLITGMGVLLAYLARSLTPLLLTYLALRKCGPRHRKEILRALGPTLADARSTYRPSRAHDR